MDAEKARDIARGKWINSHKFNLNLTEPELRRIRRTKLCEAMSLIYEARYATEPMVTNEFADIVSIQNDLQRLLSRMEKEE